MVACVVVNWNGWSDTLACLRTLVDQGGEDLEVIVVDNGSTNDSVQRIREFMNAAPAGSTRFSLLQNGRNAGYPGGANAGIHEGLQRGADFIWLLNNDTECPPDTLGKLLHVAHNRSDVGLVGTVLYYRHDPARVQAWSGGRISRWTATSIHHTRPAPMGFGSYATFASVLIRAEFLREAGVLDEGFFMYYEDCDLCMRMEATRWKLAVADDTRVLHKESASTEGARNPFMEKTITVSGLRFLTKHSPAPTLSKPLFLLLKLVNRARRGEWAACRAVLQGAGEFRSAGRRGR